MYINNRFAALLYRAALTVICFWGLYLHTVQDGVVSFAAYSYYTLLSNVACFLYFLVLTVKTAAEYRQHGLRGRTTFAPALKGTVTMMITVTILIYHFLLTPRQFSMGDMLGLLTTRNLLVHYIVPVMAVADWLVFDLKGQYRWFDPLLWMLAPLGYFVFALVRAELGQPFAATGSRYPYFFIDLDLLGYSGVAKWVLAITLFFGALGYVYYGLDRALGKRKEASRKSRPVSI